MPKSTNRDKPRLQTKEGINILIDYVYTLEGDNVIIEDLNLPNSDWHGNKTILVSQESFLYHADADHMLQFPLSLSRSRLPIRFERFLFPISDTTQAY